MVQLITNAKGFYNDMTEEVRLFLGQTDILPYAPEAELRLFVVLYKGEKKKLDIVVDKKTTTKGGAR